MLPYWILFAIPALVAIAGRDSRMWLRKSFQPSTAMALFGVLLCLFIGLRHETGGDWFNYLGHLQRTGAKEFWDALDQSDPGYRLLLWCSSQLGLGLYGVNLVAASVFCSGLVLFCSRQPRPWLALAISLPYLVIVVAMGYSRQALALGCAMLALVALEEKRLRVFLFWIVVGTTFHRTAVMLLPIIALVVSKRRVFTLLSVLAIGVVAYMAFVERDADVLYKNYVEKTYQSQGALIRLLMNAVASGFFLLWSRRMGLDAQNLKLWRWMAVLSLVLFGMLFVMPDSSTALDRIGLYFLPLQIVCFARLPDAMASNKWARHNLVMGILAGYAAVMFVWLNYANNAAAWRPYRANLFGYFF